MVDPPGGFGMTVWMINGVDLSVGSTDARFVSVRISDHNKAQDVSF